MEMECCIVNTNSLIFSFRVTSNVFITINKILRTSSEILIESLMHS